MDVLMNNEELLLNFIIFYHQLQNQSIMNISQVEKDHYFFPGISCFFFIRWRILN